MVCQSKDFLLLINRTVDAINYYESLDKTKCSYLSKKIEGFIKRNLNTIFIHNHTTHHFSKKQIFEARNHLKDPRFQKMLIDFHILTNTDDNFLCRFFTHCLPKSFQKDVSLFTRFFMHYFPMSFQNYDCLITRLFMRFLPKHFLNHFIQARVASDFTLKQGSSKKHHFALTITRDMIDETQALTENCCHKLHEIRATTDLAFSRILLNLKSCLNFSSFDRDILSDFLVQQMEVFRQCQVSVSSEFEQSIRRSCDGIHQPKRVASLITTLKNNDPDSFVMIPFITPDPHTIVAIIRMIDERPVMVIANKGGDRLHYECTLERYAFEDLEVIQKKIANIMRGRMKCEEIYDLFQEDHQESLFVPGHEKQPNQEFWNCMVKEMEYALKWTLMTSNSQAPWMDNLKERFHWPIKQMHDTFVEWSQQSHPNHRKEFQEILHEYHSLNRLKALTIDGQSGISLNACYNTSMFWLLKNADLDEIKNYFLFHSPSVFLQYLQDHGLDSAYQTACSELAMICCALAKNAIREQRWNEAQFLLQNALAALPDCQKIRGYLAFLQKDRSALREVCRENPLDLVAQDRYEQLINQA